MAAFGGMTQKFHVKVELSKNLVVFSVKLNHEGLFRLREKFSIQRRKKSSRCKTNKKEGEQVADNSYNFSSTGSQSDNQRVLGIAQSFFKFTRRFVDRFAYRFCLRFAVEFSSAVVVRLVVYNF